MNGNRYELWRSYGALPLLVVWMHCEGDSPMA